MQLYLGFQKHGLEFFSLLVPAGCPLGLLPLLVLIEFISYLARNVSLGLRLAANILSGHMLLNILAGFTYNIMTSGFIFFFLGLLPLAFITAFCGLELGIAFIQARLNLELVYELYVYIKISLYNLEVQCFYLIDNIYIVKVKWVYLNTCLSYVLFRLIFYWIAFLYLILYYNSSLYFLFFILISLMVEQDTSNI